MKKILVIGVIAAFALHLSGKSPLLLFALAADKPAFDFGSPKEIQQVMSVAEAYKAIPHLQVTFDPAQATSMSKEEAEYLHQFFSLVDLAVAERVQTQIQMMYGRGGADNQNHMEILRRMEALTPPERLKTAHDLVVTAIHEQKVFFDKWRNDSSVSVSRTNLAIQSISQKLIRAYGMYMSAYPNESAHNKNSFYQHLCALDFI